MTMLYSNTPFCVDKISHNALEVLVYLPVSKYFSSSINCNFDFKDNFVCEHHKVDID